MSEKVLEALRQAIRASGLTPRQVSLRAGINPSMTSRLLNKKQGISLETAERLAGVVGMTLTLKPTAHGRRVKGSK